MLGLAGSPRRGGNSEALLDALLAGARAAGAATEKVALPELCFSPCIACGSCEKTGECILQDDMQGLYGKIMACDALVLASPIYFYSVSAFAKAAIDRAQALWSRRYVLKDPRMGGQRKGVFVAVGATRGEKLFDGAKLTVKYFFDAAGFYPAAELLARGLDEKGAVHGRPELLGKAGELGKALAGGK